MAKMSPEVELEVERKVNLLRRISELEEEIGRHRFMLKYQDNVFTPNDDMFLFTVMGVDLSKTVVPYGELNPGEPIGPTNPKGKTLGLVRRESESDFCSIHFRDNSYGKILEYIPRVGIKGTSDIEYVIKLHYEPAQSGSWGWQHHGNTHWSTYSPAIVVLPKKEPVEFYMRWMPQDNLFREIIWRSSERGSEELGELVKFKEYILKNVNEKISYARYEIEKVKQACRFGEGYERKTMPNTVEEIERASKEFKALTGFKI